ncbi:c6 zinc finger domain containing protein [Grosmannia clavigera kw1407]|uniref:C6 zinc finger domain containing protein n=1 Tax=Grosmannia clavigera (strain kw1407 / UAMH 11150) TaxID=655863 RepID=F0XTP5_GROCL|nr:c6 zinc finger domain containing protein [Grosmannia clavigera kw1407]EFW98740.1 c6 zinc finger domain containing protein [Grosmannia clavigera kw1407]
MDFGHLEFDTLGAGDSALSTPEFDFYGTFMPTGDVTEESVASAVSVDSGLLPTTTPTTTGAILVAYSLASTGAMVSPLVHAYAYPSGSAALRPSVILPSHSSKVSKKTVTATATATTTTITTNKLLPGRLSSPDADRVRRISAAAVVSRQSEELYSAASPTSLSKRLERRGHTKSRRGCFNCKRRRIKCQETRPSCGHCVKTGLQCEYPASPLVNHQPQHQIPLFSLQDMRFFQHFLVHCCPHQPLGNETLWTHEIPCLSHNYDYLMHALLGLAASDLMQTDASLVAAAMDHRLKAIRAIKRALSPVSKQRIPATLCLPPGGTIAVKGAHGTDKANGNLETTSSSVSSVSSTSHSIRSGAASQPPPRTTWDESASGSSNPLFEEGNALMATCFALTFQSVELDDGMVEYMTFIRGILLVAIQMHIRGARLLFRNLLNNEQAEMLKPALDPMPPIERQWGEAAVAAVEELEPLCRGDDMAISYHALVLQIARALLVSPVESYAAVTRHYAWWMQLPYEQFRQIINLDRPVFVLLATHWIALKQIMVRITDAEKSFDSRLVGEQTQKESTQHGMDMGIFRWLKHLNRLVRPDFALYNEWPLWVEVQLDHNPRAFGRS